MCNWSKSHQASNQLKIRLGVAVRMCPSRFLITFVDSERLLNIIKLVITIDDFLLSTTLTYKFV